MSQQKQEQTNSIETWAIVEIMGHQKLAGFVRSQAFGGTVMLRVDVPELPARTDEQYGTRYEFPLEPARTEYVGMGSIYRMRPCTEAFARESADRMRIQPPKRLDVPAPRPALIGPGDYPDHDSSGEGTVEEDEVELQDHEGTAL